MGKFYSIGGMAPTGGEGGQGERSGGSTGKRPSMEDLERAHPQFFKDRSDYDTAPFAEAGDRFDFRGDPSEVLHVEHNQDGTQDMTVRRSTPKGDSGTYKVTVTPEPGRVQAITDVKRSFD